jgi:hypothetical protein
MNTISDRAVRLKAVEALGEVKGDESLDLPGGRLSLHPSLHGDFSR